MPTRPVQQDLAPEGGYRHLLIALDVSPSMQIEDGGPTGKLPRKKRASDVILSVLERAALDQVRVSIVAFYTGAKPVVIDTFDAEVVRNALNDLPLSWAFDIGKTDLFAGVKESADLAKGWEPRSATLLIVTDGDSIPDTGTPQLPCVASPRSPCSASATRASARSSTYQSRQDTATLRQLARRLGGDYRHQHETPLVRRTRSHQRGAPAPRHRRCRQARTRHRAGIRRLGDPRPAPARPRFGWQPVGKGVIFSPEGSGIARRADESLTP
ncbi:MAG: vWA domain-containing protein [Verrucomicrobiales bacterium]